MAKQRTIRNQVQAQGVGIHSGQSICVTLSPAPEDSGIMFRRTDCGVDIPAGVQQVVDTQLCTALGNDQTRIGTVEHLLSALAGFGIDKVLIDVDGAEIPIMDGSAEPFIFLLQSAGAVEQSQVKQFLRVKRTVRVTQGDKMAELNPLENGLRFDVTIDFDHPVIQAGPQRAVFDFSTMSYLKDISRARTFGFLHEYEQLKAMNLALGGSLENAIVLDDQQVLNEDGLRYPDEFVKHKILDAFGDLSLLGYSVLGEYRAYKAGHSLTYDLVQAVLADPSAWELVNFDGCPAPLDYQWAVAA
ncbi:MAG: UDP-3-O-acyl-N-acetylglucosamine deacetylase [Legionellales bacterium]|nr:UDP-3-O-acyl-N-acetylglucosamine deacetylase [Legionellales bacterium]